MAERASARFSTDPGQVAVARRFVRSQLRGSAPDPVSADLELVVSELVTNAIQHGVTGPVEVTVECGSDRATVTVVSRGPAPDVGPPSVWTVADADAISGRGLGIVRRLTDTIDVLSTDDTLTITAGRGFADRRGGSSS